MSKNEKLIALVAGGVILYELWKRQQAAAGSSSSQSTIQVNTTSPIPVWAQQLSAVSTTESVVSTSIEDTITNLMNLPQGPGGSYVNYTAGAAGGGLFGTTCLMGQ